MKPRIDWRWAIALGLGLALLTAIVFAEAPELGSVEYDDPDYVTRNEHVRAGLRWEGLRWAATSSFASNWFPLTWASHMLDYEIHGDDLGGFHTTNLLFHIVNTLLLYGLLLRTTGRTGRAALVAALFAVHPLHVESVAWLSERKGLLSSFFALSMLHAHVGFVRAPSRLRQLGVAAWFACGLASKPMAVTLPFVLLLLDVWPLARCDPAALGAPGTSIATRLRASGLWACLREKTLLWLLMLGGIAITLAVQAQAIVPVENLSLLDRAAGAGLAYQRYLELAIWPLGLTPIHPHPGAALSVSAGMVALLGLLAGTAVALVGLARRSAAAVGWLWFVGMLIPVVGIVQVGSALIAERYTYLPLIGLFVAVVWPVADAVRRAPWLRRVAAGFACLVVAAFAAVSFARVPDWRDTISLFENAVWANPENALAHSILGLGYAREGQDERAIDHYGQAASLNAKHHTLLYRIGRRLARKGDAETALRAFELELAIAPAYAPARNERAILWHAAGRPEEARKEFEAILEIDPNYAIVHGNLGRMLVLSDPGSEAGRRHLERAVSLAPEQVEARVRLARVLLEHGEVDAARAHLEEARRLAPGAADVTRALRGLPRGSTP